VVGCQLSVGRGRSEQIENDDEDEKDLFQA
jgi:hypothetical protein